MRTNFDKEKTVHLIECLSKIGSREQLPLLISRSISGSDLEYQHDPDYRLERIAGTYYFKLNKSGLTWESITADKNIAIYLNSISQKIDMQLVATYD